MKRRGAKARKRTANTTSVASQKKMDGEVDRAFMAACAKPPREEEAEHETQMRQLDKDIEAQQGNLPKRELSQINFRAQHWWGDGKIFKRYKKDGKIQRKMHVDEAKAALIYEAVRRRPEVQQAWVEGKFDLRPNGWQEFVGMTVQHLHCSWPELSDMTRQTFVNWMQSPWFVPPLGYSTFPDKSTPEDCEEATIQKLPGLPKPNEPAPNFMEYLRRFEDAGFIFLAIDHKSSQRDKYALNALRKLLAGLPPTCRKPDLRFIIEHHLPPNISDADKQALEEKKQQGTLSHQDYDDLWRKYIKPTSNLYAPWHTTETVRSKIAGKRERKGKRGDVPVEEKRFDFPKLFGELADLDNGKIQQSDFVMRLRLG